jgi:dihydroflavonol-4-reductase
MSSTASAAKSATSESIAPSRILVTGGAGFIGSHVVRLIRERYPHAAVRILHLPHERLNNLDGMAGLELMAGDVTVPADCERAVAGCDVVFHLAAVYAFWLRDMSIMQRVNVGGSRNLLQACRDAGVRRVVYTSSVVRFCGQGLDVESTESSPFSYHGHLYSESKLASHKLAEEFAAQGLDVVIVCPVPPMGPGDIGPTPTGRLITDIFQLPIPLAVHTRINIIDVRDCAMGHLLALERGRTGESYILGAENYTHAQIMSHVLALCGIARRPLTFRPVLLYPYAWLLKTLADLTGKPPMLTPSEIDQARLGLVCSADKARRELGLTARPIEETLRDALAWFVANGYIRDSRVTERFRLLATD